MPKVLIVDDNEDARYSLELLLKGRDFKVAQAASGEEGLAAIERERPDLVLLDVQMPGMDGFEVCRRIRARGEHPYLPVVFLTAKARDTASLVKGLEAGGDDYVTKPFEKDELLARVRAMLRIRNLYRDLMEREAEKEALSEEVRDLSGKLAGRFHLHDIIGKSRAMQEVYDIVQQAARSTASVVILGESGTGKELVASAIHYLSPRAKAPFVRVNCSAIPETLLESELYGHVKGSFTGAIRDKVGKFEAADGGTLFLDEIGDFPPPVQVKLLRFLQEREFERVGETKVRKVDVRIITATNKDLAAMVRDGRFREDLYYRLKIIPIYLPPLRERREDIPLLVEHFVAQFRKSTGRAIEGASPEAMSALMGYPWPGNVRELENAVEYAFVCCQGKQVEPHHLPREVQRGEPVEVAPAAGAGASAVPREGVSEKDRLVAALRDAQGNRSRAARILRWSRTTVWKKMKHYGLDAPR